MQFHRSRGVAAGMVSLGMALGAVGCAASTENVSSASSVDSSAPVTVVVSNQPSADQKEALATFKQSIADFEAAHPNITVEGSETAWDAETFQALLASGDLPTVLTVPFTEPQGLISRGQISDITSELKQIGLLDKLNPSALSIAQDTNGETYGVPIDAYALGLVYNRALFKKAGLDPDNPPTTWDGVRAAAAAITKATGTPGFATMTTSNTGGWMLGAMTYSYGGALQNDEGTEATINTTASQSALQLLHDMRFGDGSIGDTVLYDMTSISQAFAAGKVGMFIGAPVNYQFAVVTNGMDPDDFGMGPMPTGSSDATVLSGGAVQVISPTATDAQKLAGAEWIEWGLSTQLDQDRAVAAAKASAASKLPVGLPGVATLSESNYEQYLKWVADYVNVPLDNFAPYTSTVNQVTLRAEPRSKAQETYALLDSVVQSVLTKKDADPATLLADVQTQAQNLLSR
jgi:ABC-type glycerol-3-phosphate transport system substrate-binding protein